MKFKSPVLFTFLGALYFTFLFDKQAIGLNLLLFEIPVLAFLGYSYRSLIPNRIFLLLWGGTLLSAALVVVNNMPFSIAVNLIYLFVLVGYLAYPQSRSLLTSLEFAGMNVFGAQMQFFESFNSTKPKGISTAAIFRTLKLIVVPLFIIFVFVALYQFANPIFE